MGALPPVSTLLVFILNFKGKSQGDVGWGNVGNEEREAVRADNAAEKCDFNEEAPAGGGYCLAACFEMGET